MGIAGALKVIGAGTAWRAAGRPGAGRVLLEAVAGEDEQERMIAGMSLVKAGERSIDLIERAVADGAATPATVRLLADLGGPRARELLAAIASHSGELGRAAAESLELLNRIDGLDAGET
jgi:hypothetical protein